MVILSDDDEFGIVGDPVFLGRGCGRHHRVQRHGCDDCGPKASSVTRICFLEYADYPEVPTGGWHADKEWRFGKLTANRDRAGAVSKNAVLRPLLGKDATAVAVLRRVRL